MIEFGFIDRSSGIVFESAPLFFIINPTASNGYARNVWTILETWLGEENIPYCFALSRDADHVEILAREAASVDGAVVAGVGGDGTLSRIADGLADTAATLGVIPAGTGNDFARSFNIPFDPVSACNILLNGQTVPLDTGRLNGRIFLNVVGAGLDAEVVADANRIFKKLSGSLGYLLALLKQLVFFKPANIHILVDNKEFTACAWLVAVANACYYGSGMKVAPDADPQDGLADVIIVENIHRLNFLRLFPRVYAGRHTTHPAVRVLRGKEILITSDRPLHVHADGDLYGQTPLHVTMVKHGLRLKVPLVGE
jgi:YegS/Rv2252/BmrU family lipid kinase